MPISQLVMKAYIRNAAKFGREGVLMLSILPGPKPKKEDGTDDRRRHVDPPTAPKHPTLPVHKPPSRK